MVSLISLAVSAALPVVNVFLMCLVGLLLARKGILDPRGRQVLSQLVFWVFVPALVFTKLAKSVNLNNLAIWWILPINMIISISLGLAIGWIFAKLLRVETCFRKHFMCCIALGNVGNLPIVLVQSICSNRQTPYAQLLPNGSCEEKGIAYVAFSMWIASTFQYCVAFNLLKKPKEQDLESKGSLSHNQMGLQVQDSAVQLTVVSKGSQEDRGNKKGSIRPGEDRVDVSIAVRSGPADRADSGPGTSGSGDASMSEADREVEGEGETEGLMRQQMHQSDRGPGPNPFGEAQDDGSSRLWNQTQAGANLCRKKQKEIQRWLKGIPWGSYLNMPTLAAIAGLSVGCISAIKLLLFGDSPPLAFLTQSLETMAGGMIPCMMLILGSSLAKGPGTSSLSSKIIIASLVLRLVCIPALGTGVVWTLLKLGIFTSPDPLFLMVLLLCHAPPTAMNLQTVCTLNQSGEAEMSALLCWQYLAALVTIPLWMSLFVLMTTP